jgi:hypothetical protein
VQPGRVRRGYRKENEAVDRMAESPTPSFRGNQWQCFDPIESMRLLSFLVFRLAPKLSQNLLFVEPRLIGNLDVVSVRVADVCREVVGTPFGPRLGSLFEVAPASIAAL